MTLEKFVFFKLFWMLIWKGREGSEQRSVFPVSMKGLLLLLLPYSYISFQQLQGSCHCVLIKSLHIASLILTPTMWPRPTTVIPFHHRFLAVPQTHQGLFLMPCDGKMPQVLNFTLEAFPDCPVSCSVCFNVSSYAADSNILKLVIRIFFRNRAIGFSQTHRCR